MYTETFSKPVVTHTNNMMEPCDLFSIDDLEEFKNFNSIEKFLDPSSVTDLESNDHVEVKLEQDLSDPLNADEFAGNEMGYDQLDSLEQNKLDCDTIFSHQSHQDEENSLFQSPIKKELNIDIMGETMLDVPPTEFACRLFPQFEWEKHGFPVGFISANNPDLSGQEVLDILSDELDINTPWNEISEAASIKEESINDLIEDKKSPLLSSSSSKYNCAWREVIQEIADTNFMQLISPFLCYSDLKNENLLSELTEYPCHDHCYAKQGQPPEEHPEELKVVKQEQSQLEAAPVSENELKITIRLIPRDANQEPAKESIKEPKKRGRPKRIQPAKPLPEVKAAKKRKACSVPKRRTKKTKVQPTVSGKAKPTTSKSKPNAKQMTNDKREQHNRAERERRNNLRNHLLRLEEEVPQPVLENAQAAITYVKHESKEDIENNLSVNVMRRLDDMQKLGISGKASVKHKKGTHFPKVVVLQAAIYYHKLLDLEYQINASKIARLANILRKPEQCHMRIEKKLKVQNAIPMSKPRPSVRKS